MTAPFRPGPDPWCACGHRASEHAIACHGVDSYNCPCACPSFVPSQETVEAAEEAGTLPELEAWLAAQGFDPKARQ